LVFLSLVTVACLNLARTRPGRAWMAIRDRDIAAEALGINLTRYKLLAFMVSSTIASVSGSLMAYYTNVVTVERYTLDLAVLYVAMIIVGGMGSILGSILGAIFITLLPYGIDSLFEFLPGSWRFGSTLFGVQVGAVGLCIILFLLFEPKGLAEIWRRIETYFDRWPFRYRPLEATRR
jgi:branched-chain amino acid transport system permease protein